MVRARANGPAGLRSDGASIPRTDGETTERSGALLVVFIATLLMPISFEVAGVRLTPARLFLLIAIVPMAVGIVTGRYGRFTPVDAFFLLHGAWIALALTVVEGVSKIPFAGITAVELIGGYFVGRVLVRDIADYRRLFRIVLIAILCLLPFAVLENITGRMLIPDLLRPVFDTPFRANSAYGRMGLERAYVVFEHPILWGLFCSMTLANWIMLARGNLIKIGIGAGLSLYTTMLSLSSAPLLACSVQLGLLGWGWVMGGRWKLLMILSVTGYVVLDLLSNRTPVTILIDTLTFNPMTGYVRIAIFDYGWAAAKANPIFGIGFNDWFRPNWVTSSVDNFWLVSAMRYGMVGAAFIILAFIAHFWLLARARITDPDAAAVRLGHAIALAGVGFTLVTVHIWGALSVFVMFYVGAGAWLYSGTAQETGGGGEPQGVVESAPAERPARSRYSRFAPRPASAQDAAAAQAAAGPARTGGASRPGYSR